MRATTLGDDAVEQAHLELELANEELEARGVIGQGLDVGVERKAGAAAYFTGATHSRAAGCHRWIPLP